MNETLLTALALVPALVIAIVFHEVAHGWTALALGDPTAKERKRLTLNPIRHVDPVGTLLVPGARDTLEESGGVRCYHLRGPQIPFQKPYRLMLGRTVCVECTEKRVWTVKDGRRPGGIRTERVPEQVRALFGRKS